MIVKILKRNFGGAEFAPERGVLHLGGKDSAKVETLYFRLPEEWAGKAVTLHVQHQDGTLPSPILLDEENSVVVDKTLTASAEGLWMLQAVDTNGYCALTRPGKYDCYETFSTEGEEEITPSMYEAFVAQVAESARQAKAAAKQAQEDAEQIGDVLERAEGFADAAKESAEAAAGSEEKVGAFAASAGESAKNAARSQSEAAGSAATAATKAGEAESSAEAAKRSEVAAQQALTDTQTAAGAAQTSAGDAAQALEDTRTAKADALEKIAGEVSKAEGAASGAASSAEAAALSEQNAKTSETAAADYAKTAKEAANKATAANSTDKTLSIADVPADSKAVGERLGTKLDTESSGYAKSVQLNGHTLTITFGDGSTKTYTTQDTTDLTKMTGVLSAEHGGTGKNSALTAEDVGAVNVTSNNYIRSIAVSGNTLTMTYGDGTTNSVQLAESYTLPAATASSLGGVKVGANLSIDTSGLLSGLADGGEIVASDTGYIRYANGMQICWGNATTASIAFPVPFADTNLAVTAMDQYALEYTTTTMNSVKSGRIVGDWIVIGRWK